MEKNRVVQVRIESHNQRREVGEAEVLTPLRSVRQTCSGGMYKVAWASGSLWKEAVTL